VAKRPRTIREQSSPRPPAPTGPRPIPLSKVVGHDRALSVLMDAARAGRVHHAWIFHGPAGVGKLTAALAFAAILLDPTTQETFGGELAPDPASTVQTLLAAGTHPDLHLITKELARYHEDKDIRDRKQTTIPTEVIRDFMLDPGSRAPTAGTAARAGKVFIVDEAELLSPTAQNVTLKFLEEPPERVVVILVTSSEERLLPTIRSRCQRLHLGPLADAAMRSWVAANAPDLSGDERDWLLDFAAGSPGTLVRAREGGLIAWWRQLEPMLAEAFRGGYSLALGPTMAGLADDWAKAWVEAHDNASKEAANVAGADWMFRMVAHALTRGLRDAASGDPDATAPYLAALDAVRQAETEIDAHVNALFVMEKVSAELTAAFTPARAPGVTPRR